MTNNSDSPSLRALGYIVGGGVMLSFTSLLVALSNVGPSVSAFYRVFFGGSVVLAVAVLRGDRLWYGPKSLVIPFLCAFFFSLDLFFWHRSIHFIGPGLATILGNMQVFFVAIIAVLFLNERLGWRLMVAIPIAILGLFLIIQNSWGTHGGIVKEGVIFGLITAFSYGLYILTLRESQAADYRDRYSLFGNMAWISLISAVLLGITILLEPDASFAVPDVQSWAALLGLGILGQALGWILISKGLPKVNASVGGLALLLQPAFSFVWDIIFLGRPTSGIEYIGIGIVLSAIYLGATGKRK